MGFTAPGEWKATRAGVPLGTCPTAYSEFTSFLKVERKLECIKDIFQVFFQLYGMGLFFPFFAFLWAYIDDFTVHTWKIHRLSLIILIYLILVQAKIYVCLLE